MATCDDHACRDAAFGVEGGHVLRGSIKPTKCSCSDHSDDNLAVDPAGDFETGHDSHEESETPHDHDTCPICQSLAVVSGDTDPDVQPMDFERLIGSISIPSPSIHVLSAVSLPPLRGPPSGNNCNFYL